MVEIGTGTGVSGLWLLRGMRADGVLTTIDVEPEHQRIARRIFAEAGFAAGRTRIITGRALDVLPRLADGAYDLVFVDARRRPSSRACVEAALRLLRPGGVLAVNGALAGGRIGDPAARDVRDGDRPRDGQGASASRSDWIPALLPVGDGPARRRQVLSLTPAERAQASVGAASAAAIRTPQPVAPLTSSPSFAVGPGRARTCRCAAQRSRRSPVNSRR